MTKSSELSSNRFNFQNKRMETTPFTVKFDTFRHVTSLISESVAVSRWHTYGRRVKAVR